MLGRFFEAGLEFRREPNSEARFFRHGRRIRKSEENDNKKPKKLKNLKIFLALLADAQTMDDMKREKSSKSEQKPTASAEHAVNVVSSVPHTVARRLRQQAKARGMSRHALLRIAVESFVPLLENGGARIVDGRLVLVDAAKGTAMQPEVAPR